jgi:hypothetical protein
MDENLGVDDGFRREDGYIWMLNRAKCEVGDDLPTANSPSADRKETVRAYGCCPSLGGQRQKLT